MASTQLNNRHRLAQLQLRVAVLQELVRLWPLLNRTRLDATFPGWSAAVYRSILQARLLSAEIARQYVRAARREAGAPGALPQVRVTELPVQKAEAALARTALIAMKQATARGVDPVRQSQIGFVMSSGAATEMTLNAGRDMVIDTVTADKQATGWYRVTSDSPCYFCAMLASRGAVYKTEASAGFQPHGSCACQPSPIYDRDEPATDFAVAMARLWSDSTRGFRGHEKTLAFRRAYEKQHPPAATAAGTPTEGRSR